MVNILPCSTTMALMGLTSEDLIDGVEIGGVGTFLGNSFDSQVTIFMWRAGLGARAVPRASQASEGFILSRALGRE